MVTPCYLCMPDTDVRMINIFRDLCECFVVLIEIGMPV